MDKKSKVDDVYLQIADSYLHRLRESEIPISKAFIFGSRATGTAHKWSDLDICVVSPIFGLNRFDERVRLMNLRTGVSDLIEPHPYSPEDFDNRFDSLAVQVKTTGVQIA